MNGITINIDPVIFQLGHFEVRWYSVAIMLAVVAAVLITMRRAGKRGIPGEQIFSLALWVVLGGLLGARLFHVIDRWEYYAGNPLQIIQLQQGGLAIWGALAGGGLALLVYARIKQLPLGRLVDAVTPGLLVAQIIGRFGCIVNGDAYGGVTGLPWGFIYVNPGASIPPDLFGLPTHPYPVYEIIWNGLVLLGVLKLERRFTTSGVTFLGYLALYSLGRFILTFVRQENLTLGGLQQAQIIALLAMAVSLLAIAFIMVKNRFTTKVALE
ncbi:MAG: prolipoprotein diacylglyceryl transferase [Chloroflexi bacterium RBG_16_56_11]|nr:MAG: prolipoprotein diacylglyceryl transferase [Chloroflexi bacterium RBG_16_56_11]